MSKDCPKPITLRTGERHCTACNATWDADEPPPMCMPEGFRGKRVLVYGGGTQVAQTELAKIREILSRNNPHKS